MDNRLERFVHWMGLVGALGGLVWSAALLMAAFVPGTLSRTYTPMMVAGLVLMGLGVIGGHVRLTRRTGLMGWFALALTALALIGLVAAWLLVETAEADAIYFAMAFMLMLVNFVIFAIMALWSSGISRIGLVIMLIGILALPFMDIRTTNIWQGVVFGAGWLLVGVDLLRAHIGEETAVPA